MTTSIIPITDVRVNVPTAPGRTRLLAHVSVELAGCWAIHDLRVVRGKDGRVFISLPSKKVRDNCPGCACKVSLDSAYCWSCGEKLDPWRNPNDGGRGLYKDLVHPLNAEARRVLETAVLEAVRKALPGVLEAGAARSA